MLGKLPTIQVDRFSWNDNFKKHLVVKYNLFTFAVNLEGELAHLVERQVRNLKVVGSSPIFSTVMRRLCKRLFLLYFNLFCCAIAI